MESLNVAETRLASVAVVNVGEYSLLGITGDQEKITHISPTLGGFQLGISLNTEATSFATNIGL